MWLIVGLGNPGRKYQFNRHNVGFMVADFIFENSRGQAQWKQESGGLVAKVIISNVEAILLKPQSFMNLSGEPVQAVAKYYKIDLDKIIVAHDEIDLEFSDIKFQFDRGHGGHNGIRSIHKHLGSNKYHRIKIGVGRPQNSNMEVADYVLQNFGAVEIELLRNILERCFTGVETLIKDGYQKTATLFNQKPPSGERK